MMAAKNFAGGGGGRGGIGVAVLDQSILGLCLGQAILNEQPYLAVQHGQIQTLFRTEWPSMYVISPFQGREAKNHPLSNVTSPYRPHKG